MNIPTKEENRFLNYLEEYMLNLEKEKPNSIGKIDLPGFSVFGIHESIIISKSYGFIKRLVDNDKINFDKLEDYSDWYGIDLGDYCNEVIAFLSIQDNPIEFLVSILK